MRRLLGLGLVVACVAGTAAAFASTAPGSGAPGSTAPGSGAPGSTAPGSTAPGSGARSSTAGNERAAGADVRRLFASIVLPPGATPANVDPAPGSTLSSPAFATATPARVDRHGFWRVPGAPEGVIDWIEAHTPAGSTGVFGTGVSARHGVPYAWSVTFSFPPVADVLLSRTVGVLATAARGGGTGLRADAEVVWSVLRPRWEQIPSGVRLVTLVDHRVGRRAASASRTVTGRHKVGRIVALIDGLARAQPGFRSCPMDRGPLVDMTFRTSASAPPVAVASADGSGCGAVTLRIRGRMGPPLSGGWGLINALDSLLGARF